MSKKPYTDYVQAAIRYYLKITAESEPINPAWSANYAAVDRVYKTLTADQRAMLRQVYAVQPSEVYHFARNVERLVAIERGLIEDEADQPEQKNQSESTKQIRTIAPRGCE